MAGHLFSPGKLLLTSEYVVLDGALALALPTNWGQEFFYEEKPDGKSTVFWTSQVQGNDWVHAEFNYESARILTTNQPEKAEFLLKLLTYIKENSRTRLQSSHSYRLGANLEFPANFGLGSSSTLIQNLAEWSDTDAFDFNEKCLGGSGYDIAVAQEKCALLYRRTRSGPKVEPIDFLPAFREELLFVHLNQKQDSREGINHYRQKTKDAALLEQFSDLTRQLIDTEKIERFEELMLRHETMLSEFLQLKTVKELHFADCPVFVKSLGAWGGDFVMTRKFPDFEQYFSTKGFTTIIGWAEMISEKTSH